MQETVSTLVWMTGSPPSPIHLFSLMNFTEDSQKTPHSPSPISSTCPPPHPYSSHPTNSRWRDWLSS